MARRAVKLAALAGLAKQARDYAQKNPESVSSAIGKVESAVSRKVGPKYANHVGKGGKALRTGLGISKTSGGSITPPSSANPSTSNPPSPNPS